MSDDSQSLLGRLGGIFRRGNRAAAAAEEAEDNPGASGLVKLPDGTPAKPIARRDQALSNLQEGFGTLTDLMAGIRENLGDQGRRQDELLGYLSHLPKAIEGIPETNRLQVESLKAISARLDQQNDQQRLIGEILGKLVDNDQQQQQRVEEIGSRVEAVAEQNKTISDNLSGVGTALQGVSKTSQASTQVLSQLRDSFERRDGQIERILRRQASRFTAMLTVAIVLSVAALAAVGFFGWKIVHTPGGAATTRGVDR
jgi:chromosome segregation ATPase